VVPRKARSRVIINPIIKNYIGLPESKPEPPASTLVHLHPKFVFPGYVKSRPAKCKNKKSKQNKKIKYVEKQKVRKVIYV